MTELKPWCTCTGQQGWTRLGDTDWWVHPLCGKATKMFWEKSMQIPGEGRFWAPPPPGLTVTTARIGPDVYELFTYRCEEDPNCYALEHSKRADRAQAAIKDHICPAEPRRDMVPSGKTVVQKLWDELDDTIDHIKLYPNDPDFLGHKGHAEGIALALALMSTPWFRSQEDILRQANKRWRMRHDEIPWQMTPGYNYYPAAPLRFPVKEETSPVKKRQPVSKAVKTVKPSAPPAPPKVEFTSASRNLIRQGIHSGTTTAAQFAKMYGVSEERIMTIAGPEPDSSDAMPMGMMF